MGIVANTQGSEALFDLVDERAEVERLANGFGFTEGPVWNASEGYLVFSDLTESKRCQWHASSGEVKIAMDPSNMGCGMTYDGSGNLLICEHATSSVVRESPDGARETVASHYQGKELNSPNDIVTTTDGSIYFTDPPFGRFPVWGVEREQDLDFQGVYRLNADGGEPQLLVDDFDGPNGLCFSPDNSLLYINDTLKAHIRVFEVNGDGSLASDRIFAEGIGKGDPEEGVVDGMKTDERGNVYVTGPGGIWAFAPSGEHLGLIEVPEGVGNFAFGDSDWKTIYITASTGIYRVAAKVASHREPYM